MAAQGTARHLAPFTFPCLLLCLLATLHFNVSIAGIIGCSELAIDTMVFYFTPRGHGPGPEDWLLYMVRQRIGTACILPSPALCTPCKPPPLCPALPSVDVDRSFSHAAAMPSNEYSNVKPLESRIDMRGAFGGKDTFSAPAKQPLQGADKYENEDLIKYSLPHDVWFHVDNLSSAHVYLRLPQGAHAGRRHAAAGDACGQASCATRLKRNPLDLLAVLPGLCMLTAIR